jgi:hypothetical protein
MTNLERLMKEVDAWRTEQGRAGLEGSGKEGQPDNGRKDLVNLSTLSSPRPELQSKAEQGREDEETNDPSGRVVSENPKGVIQSQGSVSRQTRPELRSAPHSGRKNYELVKRIEEANRDIWLYDWVYERGISCYFCGEDVNLSDFAIHHLDKAYSPLNARENTTLSHPKCNRVHNEFESSAPHVRVSEKKSLNVVESDPTIMLRQVVEYARGSAEMQANGEAEPDFIRGLWHAVAKSKNHAVLKQEAINGLAYLIGVSPSTTRKYLDKQTSEQGPFMEQGSGSLKVVTLKPEWKPRLKEEMAK